MFKRNSAKNRNSATAETAAARARLYGLLVRLFTQLPDGDLLNQIRAGTYEEWFQGFHGVELLRGYRSGLDGAPTQETLTTLSVDRTKILRGTGPRTMKPPYEGCYKEEGNLCSAAMEVRRYYRSAGLLPDETVPDSPDYLCVEMDFMRQLCLRERDLWVSNGNASDTMSCEARFLRRHLGTWVGGFCKMAQKHAMTDFYRGCALILDSFITMEQAFLRDIT